MISDLLGFDEHKDLRAEKQHCRERGKQTLYSTTMAKRYNGV
jgi:hypothetical protein